MNRNEFFETLRKGLAGLPQEDIDSSIDFYNEMVQDRMEDGLTEEEAVTAIGPVQEIVAQILSETSLTKLVKAKVNQNRAWKAWEIILLILGSPIWLTLLIAAVIIVLAVYIVIWSVIITLYAADISLAFGGIAGILGFFAYFPTGNVAGAVLFIGAGLVCAGFSILLFFGSNQVTKGVIYISRLIWRGIKSMFIRKETA